MKSLLIFLLAFSTVFLRAQTSPTVRFNSMAELVAYAIPSVNSKLSAIVSGSAATGDSFLAGEFAYSASSSATTNEYSIFKPTGTTGRWIRITGATWNQIPNITNPSQEPSYAFQMTRGVGTNALHMGVSATNVIIQTFSSLPLFINPVGANNVIFNELGGNVGIGTPSPSGKLEVFNDAGLGGVINLSKNTSTSRGAIQFGRNNAGAHQTAANISVDSDVLGLTNGIVNINIANSTGSLGPAMTISSSKVVFSGITNGFNVTTPASELHVGSTSTATPRGITSAQYSTSTHGAVFGGRKARGSEATPTTVVTGDTIFELSGAGYDSANYLKMAQIRYEASGTIAATRVPTQIVFATATDATPSVLTDRMTILNNGNVGIGIVPIFRLDISGGNLRLDNNTSIIIKTSGGANASAVSMSASDNLSIGQNNANFTALNLFGGTGNVNIYAGAVAAAAFKSDGTSGIGTTAPGSFGLAINHATGQSLDLIYNDSDGSPVNHAKITVGSGGILTIEPLTSTTTPTSVAVVGKLATTATAVTLGAAATTFAVASNVVTVTGDAGANTVATITGGVSGQILTLILADALVTVTDNATGTANTINLSAAFVSTANDVLSLVFNGTSWREVARSVN